jgi:hypothetical protein
MSAYFLRSACVCAAVLSLSFLTGCANYIFKTFDIDQSNESLSLDAKQRVVLVTERGGKDRNQKIVCAEPSPDALSAIAASASGAAAVTIPGTGGGGATGGSGGFAGGMSESVASLAMRTQTIQLLRDGYYRLCEAYMNGAIDKHQYNVVLVNIDRLMETLLGIDGIAGTRNVAPVAISAVAPPTSTTASPTTTTATESPTPAPTPPAGQPPGLNIGTVTVSSPGAVQSEAIANIVLAANSGTSFPALCISLLASGEMDPNNRGQHSVLKRCDYLLNGAAYRYITSRVPVHPTPTRYQVSPNAAAAQVNKCPNGPDGKPVAGCT